MALERERVSTTETRCPVCGCFPSDSWGCFCDNGDCPCSEGDEEW